ncbi:MAG: 4Fe-4S binding protein [Candidatus Thorarchaeota archaeon]
MRTHRGRGMGGRGRRVGLWGPQGGGFGRGRRWNIDHTVANIDPSWPEPTAFSQSPSSTEEKETARTVSVPSSSQTPSFPYPQVNDSCIGCGTCVRACPMGAIAMVDGIAKVDPKICARCGVCISVCPVNAIAFR